MSSKISQKKTSTTNNNNSNNGSSSNNNNNNTLEQVKLRRKESSTKNSQVDNQRKSGVFRFLHRDKKKNPELPEHGFIPDARRVLEGPSKSLSESRGIVPAAVRSRWSSFEPVDFSQLSATNKTKDPTTPPAALASAMTLARPTTATTATTSTVADSEETMTGKRCFSREFVAKPGNDSNPTSETSGEKEANCSADQKLSSNVALGEKMRQIDEKLNAALKDRRIILEKILKSPSKSFPGPPSLQHLLLDSFLSSETLTKLASHSMNSPGNAVTSEDMKVLKETILDLQRNLTIISELICSERRKDKSDDLRDLRSSSSSSLARDSDSTCDERQQPIQPTATTSTPTTFNVDDVAVPEKAPTADAIADITEYWMSLECTESWLSVECHDDEQAVLCKIDEENEDASSPDRNSSPPPLVPLETHPLNDPFVGSSRGSEPPSVTYVEDGSFGGEASEKEKTTPVAFRKSSSTTSFQELKIQHSSIAEEDEETLGEENEDFHEVHSAEPLMDAETEELKIVEDPISVETGRESQKNEEDVSEMKVFDEEILFDRVDGGKEQEPQNQLCTAAVNNDIASEPLSDNCKDVTLFVSRTEDVVGYHARNGEDECNLDNCDVDLARKSHDVEVNKILDSVKFDTERQTKLDDVVVSVVDSQTLINESSIAQESLCRTEDSNDNPALQVNNAKLEEFNINENCQEPFGASLPTGGSNCCGDDLCSLTKQLPVGEEVDKTREVEEAATEIASLEAFATTTEVTDEVVERLPTRDSLPEEVVQAPKVEPVLEEELELKIENIEILVCSEARLDSLGSNDDTSDSSTPTNGDVCEPPQISSQQQAEEEEAKQREKEGGVVQLSQEQESLPSSEKTGNNKKRRNKKKKKNHQQQQQQQQQTINSHDKDSRNLKEMSQAIDKEAIVATQR